MAKKHYKERKEKKLAKREQRILERRKKQRIRIIGAILVIICVVVPLSVYAYFNLPKNGTKLPENEMSNENIEIEWYNYDEGMSISGSENKPVMIDFYYDGCGWCDKLDETTYTDSRVIEKSKSFACIKVDVYGVDSYYGQKGQELAAQYSITGCPTVVFLNSQGSVVNRVSGYRDADAFLEEMNKALTYS